MGEQWDLRPQNTWRYAQNRTNASARCAIDLLIVISVAVFYVNQAEAEIEANENNLNKTHRSQITAITAH